MLQAQRPSTVHVVGDESTSRPGCVDQYLELARVTDEAVQTSEPGMFTITFSVMTERIPRHSVWSEVYANDEVRSVPMFPDHSSSGTYLQICHVELGPWVQR